jgi:hypothetical protein
MNVDKVNECLFILFIVNFIELPENSKHMESSASNDKNRGDIMLR